MKYYPIVASNFSTVLKDDIQNVTKISADSAILDGSADDNVEAWLSGSVPLIAWPFIISGGSYSFLALLSS